jgi:hypothetical protein
MDLIAEYRIRLNKIDKSALPQDIKEELVLADSDELELAVELGKKG